MEEQGQQIDVAQMLKALLEDRERRDAELAEERRRREEELAEERRQREEERRAREAEMREERRLRDDEAERRDVESRRQMEFLKSLVEGVQMRGETAALKAEKEKDVRVAKLSESDDIEAYLTTFERQMQAYEVKRERWAFKLAPQLSGKAQQAYASMPTEDAGNYEKLKATILLRYDVTEERYRQRFRSARRKDGETNMELVTRLGDLANKWLKACDTAEEVKDAVVLEQLLNSLLDDVRVFVRDRKPKTSAEAGKLADDYFTARREARGDKKLQKPVVRCETCKKLGHTASECRRDMYTKATPAAEKGKEETPKTRPKRDLNAITCFNCQKKGHFSYDCPSNALLCQEAAMRPRIETKRAGTVEGKPVDNLLLDTGCTRTLIRRELVSDEKMLEGRAVPIRCAHGDTVLYPLAMVSITVGGKELEVEAAVSDTLPMDALLGTDVSGFDSLLGQEPTGEAMALMTRAQKKRETQEEETRKEREEKSGASPKAVDSEHNFHWGEGFAEELFEGGRERPQLTRSQKRQERHRRYNTEEGTAEATPETSVSEPNYPHALDISAGELQTLQAADPSLYMVRRAADGHPCSAGVGFFRKEGLIYRLWTPPGRCHDSTEVEQLVLPMQCRKTVLHTAHDIPLSGHLGKKKTTTRLLQRFYWPTIHRDVAEYCRTCSVCQKTSRRKGHRAPMIPLPIIEEPFSRIAMDIVGPVPKSRSGNRYVLVICDYATRYPEAVPLKSIDAEHVAEELVKLFSRVGVPREILTDQGSNFTSQLLSEIYQLLHVHPIRTTPYHPQTDGLVERFNQTLKSMLRKAAVQEGKDWDKLLPYVLFAYREVPQASTGFSPFELVFGRAVRGPLDVIRERWEASEKSDESVVSHVLSMREKLAKMTELVQENLSNAQEIQKRWYDRNAREREFQPDDQVLILLPTTTNKLTAQWQGPYKVIKKVGKVDYQIRLHDRRKKNRTFHANMLRKWHTPAAAGYAAEEVDTSADEDIPVWNEGAQHDSEQVSIGEQLDEEQREELAQLLEEYSDVFQNKPGRTSLVEHSIRAPNAAPIRLPPYRVPQAYRDEVKKEITEMLAEGIIEPSSSEWSFPMVLVKKKDGSLRLCVDFRRLNQVSECDAYPMPRIDDLIDRVGKSAFISTLDLTRGYWQVPVEEGAQAKTAFTTPFGLFQFRVMPFGLQGAPATFQRLMDRVIRGLDFAAAYLDDLIVVSKTWEEHLEHLRAVLGRLRAAGLTAKARKCEFGAAECNYLGHVVGSGLVKPQESKLFAIKAFSIPATKKEVRAFLGITGYYRRFIANYSEVAAPLTDLTKKSSPNAVIWTAECDKAFRELKEKLCTMPILRSPDFDSAFILQTDASDRGIGAVLSQRADDGEEHPVAYWSRKLLPREQRYSTIEKECLAIKLGAEAFKVYLLGRTFTIETDHRSLVWMERLKDTNNRLARWSLALQCFCFSVKHRAGSLNGNADALSRAATN